MSKRAVRVRTINLDYAIDADTFTITTNFTGKVIKVMHTKTGGNCTGLKALTAIAQLEVDKEQ